MKTVPKFKIYDDQETSDGVFEWGESRNEIFELYYEACDLYYMGDIEEAKVILKDIIKKDKHFIDAYNQC